MKLMLVSFKDLVGPMNARRNDDDYKKFFSSHTPFFSITEYFPFDEQTCVMKFGKHICERPCERLKGYKIPTRNL